MMGKVRTVPPPEPPIPFSVDTATSVSVPTVEFRTSDQITQSDRLLVANAESSIAEHAGLNGMAFAEGNWNYQQIVCPALPNHLFLQYTRNNGTGDVSVFSASIPREGEGRVRIIPILKRGYSLFSPTSINALTISVFNHIRVEEPMQDRSAKWEGNALCYAALAGAHPQIVAPDAEPAPGKPIPAMTAVMFVNVKGGETIRFADAAAKPRPMEWTMTFTARGKLVKATHTPVQMYAARPVSKESPVRSTRVVPQGAQ